MGLTVFKGSRPVKSEVTAAKNYMTEKELFALRRMVNAFFDMAELKVEMHEPMYMRDWLETLDKFSRDFSVSVLEGAGSVSHIEAAKKAHLEYEAYRSAKKAGDPMPSGIEVIKAALDDFAKVQRRMLLAKKENAMKTYADLKDEYLTLKALLNISGVNLTELDKIKE